jgi:hypothetical protein
MGSQRNCRSLSSIRPRARIAAPSLGTAGRARGVDQRGERVGTGPGDPPLDDVGVLPQQVRTQLLEVGEGHQPVPVGGPVERDHTLQKRQLRAALPQLGDLGVVLGEHHSGLGVGQDVADLLWDRGGVDGRGRGAGAHDRQVRKDPLVAGGRRDGGALLGLETE